MRLEVEMLITGEETQVSPYRTAVGRDGQTPWVPAYLGVLGKGALILGRAWYYRCLSPSRTFLVPIFVQCSTSNHERRSLEEGTIGQR